MGKNEAEEMSTTEMWREVKRRSQHRRAENRENSAATLQKWQAAQPDLQVETRNAGAHLIVRFRGRIVDFWPGTGAWIDRAQRGVKMRGVHRMLKHLGLGQLQ